MNSEQKMSKTLSFFLWIAQGLLAATFLWAGYMKIFKPEALSWAWIKENPNLVTTTGILDLLSGIGIVFPTLLRIRPKLTVFAAYGIVALMLGASIFHIARGEAKDIGFNVFVALLAGFVAWGRR
jgi:hypothetical protein